MRILIINSEYPPVGGGAANASANLARVLVDLGQEVTVLTARHAGLPVDEVQRGVRVVRVSPSRRFQDRSTPAEQIGFIFGSIFGAVPLVRAWRPHVVLAFFGAPSGITALFLKVLFGIPYIVSLRGGDVPGFRPYDFAVYHRLLGPLLHVVWRRAAAVVANSEGLRALGQAFDSHVPIKIIPNGVDIERFSTGERDWSPARMLIVGRLVYQKGIDLLLEALAELADIPWELSVVGDGPQRPTLESMAAQLGLVDRVRFHGWQDGDDLVARYRRANIFVYPSRHEGMPNAVLEAMGCGLPVLASAIAGNEELVLPEETGVLVPPEDVGAVRAALRALLPDAARRQRMGAAARVRVQEHYTWAGVARQYLELLEAAGGSG